jgi:transposase
MDNLIMGVQEARRLGLVEAALRGETTVAKVALALGLSRRQVQRLKRRVAERGPAGLVHGNRGRKSARRLPAKIRRRIERLLNHRTVRLNDHHIVDLLAAEQPPVTVSVDRVRRLRQALGRAPVHQRRPPRHHRRRERRAREGSMVLIDGSEHAWLGAGHVRLALVGAIDDATSKVLALTFRPQEDLHGYAVVLREVLTRHGVPEAFYGDRTGIAVRNDDRWSLEEQLAGRQLPPQFGQMLGELGIRYIAARSPQAKGRIERLWRTLQDRLLKELRLRRITTVEAAQAYLPGFLERHNRRFAVAPRETASAWQQPPRGLDLMLACRYTRTVSRDNVVTLPGCVLHLPPGPQRRSHHGRKVEVRELLDGRMVVRDGDRVLLQQAAPTDGFTLVPRGHRSEHRRIERTNRAPGSPRIADRPSPRPTPQPLAPAPAAKPKPVPPAANHPWRKSYDPKLMPPKARAGG